MENRQICQWCSSEIIWDEEIGPEEYCPHCDNKLNGYRTMEIGIDNGEGNSRTDGNAADRNRWLDDSDEDDIEEEDAAPDSSWMDEGEGFRSSHRSSIAIESAAQRIIDGQDEVPECPVCREYMLEAGTQTVGGDSFEPAVPVVVGQAIVPNPFRVIWYICPSCFHTSSMLSPLDREAMALRLMPKD